MAPRKPLTKRGVERMSERERSVGLDADDAAARWLSEHDPPPEPTESKSLTKSVALHRWRERERRSQS